MYNLTFQKFGHRSFSFVFFTFTFLSLLSNRLNAQINASTGGGFDDRVNNATWSFTIDNNDNEAPGYFRWWTDGGDNFSELIMELTENSNHTILGLPTSYTNSILSLSANNNKSSFSDESVFPFIFLETGDARSSIFYGKDNMLNFSINPKTINSSSSFPYSTGFRFLNSNGKNILAQPSSYGTELMRISADGNVGIGTTNPTEKLDVRGAIKINTGYQDYYAIISNFIGGGYGDFGIRTNRGNINFESNGTIRIKSLNANTISIGDDNDVVTINGEIKAKDRYAFSNDNVLIGNGAGKDVQNDNHRRHVFIGHDAGIKSAFDEISLIDYEDPENNDPVTGSEYIKNHSVFVLNNHQDLHKPLLFGKFAHEGSQNSMAQLAINTHHVVDSVALTVSGAVHIGPKNINPTLFPSKEGYEDALLWVERGIVTEDVTYAFTSNWDEWPDHVFEENYDLMPLVELEKYIKEHQHLPGVLSREDVKSRGVNSKEIIVALLTKIEELTLYAIEQKNQIDNQSHLNDEMKIRLANLEDLVLNMVK